jgi:hypothetical protein
MDFYKIRKLAKSFNDDLMSSHLSNIERTLDEGLVPERSKIVNTPEAYQTSRPTETKIDGIIFKVPQWALSAGKHPYDALAAMDSKGRTERLGAVHTEGPHAGTRYFSSYALLPLEIYYLAFNNPRLSETDFGRHILYLGDQYSKNIEEFGRAINKLTENPAFDDLLIHHKIEDIFQTIKELDLSIEDQIKAIAFAHHYGKDALKEAVAREGNLEASDPDSYVSQFMSHMDGDTEECRRSIHNRNTFYNQNPNDVIPMRVQSETDTEPQKMDPLQKGSVGRTLGILGLGYLGGAASFSPELRAGIKNVASGIGEAIPKGMSDAWSMPKHPLLRDEPKQEPVPKESVPKEPTKKPVATVKKPEKTPSYPLPPTKAPDYSHPVPKGTATPTGPTPKNSLNYKLLPEGQVHHPKLSSEFRELASKLGWVKDQKANIMDIFAAAESQAHASRVHPWIAKGENKGTRAVSSYGLMPMHIKFLSEADPVIRNSSIGAHIRDMTNKHFKSNNLGRFGLEMNKLSEDRVIDDFLMDRHMNWMNNYVTRLGFKPKNQKLYNDSLAFLHFYGSGALNAAVENRGRKGIYTYVDEVNKKRKAKAEAEGKEYVPLFDYLKHFNSYQHPRSERYYQIEEARKSRLSHYGYLTAPEGVGSTPSK